MSAKARYLATTVALVGVALGYGVLQARIDRPAPPRPSSPTVTSPTRPVPAPLARDILERAVALRLTGQQRERLAELEREWAKDAARLEDDITRRTDEFAGFMREAQGKRGTSLEEIRRQSATISELSGELRERRRIHSAAAAGVLTTGQRARLGSVSGERRAEASTQAVPGGNR